MLLHILSYIANNLMFFTGAYSNNVFPDQLPKEVEDDLIKKMKNGDKEARNKLIEHNLRLVAHIVKKFETADQDTDDLIGIGTVGLIKGIDTYKDNLWDFSILPISENKLFEIEINSLITLMRMIYLKKIMI